MAANARYLWSRLEAYHGLIYFAPEADQHYTALGLDPGMMGYFASRAAAMGEVAPDVVVATFYNFEPTRIRKLVPVAWQRTSAADLWQARLQAADAALTRVLGERLHQPDVAAAAALLQSLVPACAPDGRPLFAGHLSQQWPTEPYLQLWFAITLLREFRGDGHIAALTVEGVSGLEALVLHAATGAVPAAVLQATRGWSDEAWQAALARLQQRSWVDDDGTLTLSGQQHRDRVERQTDELAAAPWDQLDAEQVAFLAALGKDLSGAIAGSGMFPSR